MLCKFCQFSSLNVFLGGACKISLPMSTTINSAGLDQCSTPQVQNIITSRKEMLHLDQQLDAPSTSFTLFTIVVSKNDLTYILNKQIECNMWIKICLFNHACIKNECSQV